MVSTDIAVWMAAFFGISILSILYKENPFYRLTEHIYIAVATAQAMVLAWETTQMSAGIGLAKGELLWIIPIILAIMMCVRLVQRYRWVSRWPMAVMLGIGMGVTARSILRTNILDQITSTIGLVTITDPTPYNIALNALLMVSSICGVVYFFFFLQHKGPVGAAARFGRLSLMAYFGTALAWVFEQRSMSTVYRLLYFFRQWLGIV